jgi:integrase/recombinase XerD
VLTRQAKVLDAAQQATLLRYVETCWRPERNAVIVRLNFELFCRATEIACLRWRMVCDVQGRLGEAIALDDKASKGQGGGRFLPLTDAVYDALARLQRRAQPVDPEAFVVQFRKRSQAPVIRSQAVQALFRSWYRVLGFHGASSHSGRRTGITRAAREATQLGLSLVDVQRLAGHANLATTQRYIEPNGERHRLLLERLTVRPTMVKVVRARSADVALQEPARVRMT